MEKIRIRPGLALMAAGLCFLANPLVNVIDVLPDVIGWLLIALSMTTLAYVNDDIAAARRSAWILFGITLAKTAPMTFSLLGSKVLPLLAEPVMVLVYTISFGIFELYLGSKVIRTWLAGISQMGLLHDSKASIRGTDGLRLMTFFFFLLRTVGSIVPELVYLRSTEYLGNVVYGVVIDIRDYRPYLIIFCAFCAGVFAIGWLIAMLRYIRGLSKDRNGAFGAALQQLEEERQPAVLCKSTLERFRIAFALMLVGGVFLCHFTFEYVNVLPDFVGVLLLLTAACLLHKKCPFPKAFYRLGIGTAILTVPYYIIRTVHSLNYHNFWAESIYDYVTRNISVSAENQTIQMGLQLQMLFLAIAETILLILFFRKFLLSVGNLNQLTFDDRVTLYDSMTQHMMQAEKQKYERRPKKVMIWFCISALMEVVRALPVFSFVVTPIALIRIVINVIFIAVFTEYLLSLERVIVYHYRYNPENGGSERDNGDLHALLH